MRGNDYDVAISTLSAAVVSFRQCGRRKAKLHTGSQRLAFEVQGTAIVTAAGTSMPLSTAGPLEVVAAAAFAVVPGSCFAAMLKGLIGETDAAERDAAPSLELPGRGEEKQKSAITVSAQVPQATGAADNAAALLDLSTAREPQAPAAKLPTAPEGGPTQEKNIHGIVNRTKRKDDDPASAAALLAVAPVALPSTPAILPDLSVAAVGEEQPQRVRIEPPAPQQTGVEVENWPHPAEFGELAFSLHLRTSSEAPAPELHFTPNISEPALKPGPKGQPPAAGPEVTPPVMARQPVASRDSHEAMQSVPAPAATLRTAGPREPHSEAPEPPARNEHTAAVRADVLLPPYAPAMVRPAQARVAEPVQPEAAPPAVPEESHPVPEPQRTTVPARQLHFEIGGADRQSVHVQVADRGGEFHVTVRTPDAGLASHLRGNLNELTRALHSSGYVDQAGALSVRQSSSGAAAEQNGPRGGHHGGAQQQFQQQRRNPQWPAPDESTTDEQSFRSTLNVTLG